MAFRPSRIVAYGCSYTAGQELADAIILNKTHDEIDAYKRKHGIHCIDGVYGSKENLSACDKLSSELAWPNYIAERFGIPCINRAEKGTSVNEFIFNIERDLITGKIEPTDLILVGLTSPVRFSWVTKFGHMMTKFVGDERWTYNSELNYALLDTWATDCNLIWEYFKHARHLDLLSSCMGGRLKTVMTVQSIESIKIALPDYKHRLPWIDSLKLHNLLSPELSLSNFIEDGKWDEQTHGWGHPKVEVHERYAAHIYDQLISAGVVHD